jgi:hypothetical protein
MVILSASSLKPGTQTPPLAIQTPSSLYHTPIDMSPEFDLLKCYAGIVQGLCQATQRPVRALHPQGRSMTSLARNASEGNGLMHRVALSGLFSACISLGRRQWTPAEHQLPALEVSDRAL